MAVSTMPEPAKKQQVAVQSTIKDLRPAEKDRLFRSFAIAAIWRGIAYFVRFAAQRAAAETYRNSRRSMASRSSRLMRRLAMSLENSSAAEYWFR